MSPISIAFVGATVAVFFALGRTRLGYVGSWGITALVQVAVFLSGYWVVSSGYVTGRDALYVVGVALLVSLAGPLILCVAAVLRRYRRL